MLTHIFDIYMKPNSPLQLDTASDFEHILIIMSLGFFEFAIV